MKQYYNELELKNEISKKMTGTYLWMFFGLLITGSIIMYGMTNITLLRFSYNISRISMLVILVLIFSINSAIRAKNIIYLKALFVAYSVFFGIFLLPFTYIYELSSVLSMLLGTSVTFLAMSIYGMVTDNNLQGYSKYLFGGLIGIIALMFLNMFFKVEGLNLIISFVGLFIFIIYTAVDTQRIKENITSLYFHGDYEVIERVQIIGALSLYIDFVNIFIKMLALFGKRK